MADGTSLLLDEGNRLKKYASGKYTRLRAQFTIFY